jgi:glycosyltransferase involved in cell wall biosynthesis
MSQTPSASLIVPAYNVSATIAETLHSLLRQTHTDLEVIVVNDGSTDNTVEVVSGFADPRLRIVHQANRGLAGARNTGIHEARGAFIGFCDADDLWLPEKLELHIAHLKARPDVGISFSGSQMIDELGKPLGISQKPRLKAISAEHVYKRNPIGNGSAALIRREALNALAFRPMGETERDWWFDESFRQSEDIECWLRFALTLDWRIEGIAGDLTLYRIHTNVLSANVERQYDTWKRMTARMEAISPAFVARFRPVAEAYQLRYLARRAVSMRDGAVAGRLAWRAMRLSTKPLFEEPLKTITTLAAATLLQVIGAKSYRWAETRVLRLKNS